MKKNPAKKNLVQLAVECGDQIKKNNDKLPVNIPITKLTSPTKQSDLKKILANLANDTFGLNKIAETGFRLLNDHITIDDIDHPEILMILK